MLYYLFYGFATLLFALCFIKLKTKKAYLVRLIIFGIILAIVLITFILSCTSADTPAVLIILDIPVVLLISLRIGFDYKNFKKINKDDCEVKTKENEDNKLDIE